ncbi:splicing factor 3A subunit 1-like, partial [Sceloporus undulatus]|uniref:splicing factor 3A subunit 1-like n=1 Tax=Sceloporus undulatus TaxID=8520 RepID=UPI001C4B20D1
AQQQLPQKLQAQVIQETVVPKEPPPEFEFIADPPSISAFDLDVVKLTAQFVSRNGRQFLTQLMQKEQRNYQFDFLRPQHSLFNYFTKLVEQYTKVMGSGRLHCALGSSLISDVKQGQPWLALGWGSGRGECRDLGRNRANCRR